MLCAMGVMEHLEQYSGTIRQKKWNERPLDLGDLPTKVSKPFGAEVRVYYALCRTN